MISPLKIKYAIENDIFPLIKKAGLDGFSNPTKDLLKKCWLVKGRPHNGHGATVKIGKPGEFSKLHVSPSVDTFSKQKKGLLFLHEAVHGLQIRRTPSLYLSPQKQAGASELKNCLTSEGYLKIASEEKTKGKLSLSSKKAILKTFYQDEEAFLNQLPSEQLTRIKIHNLSEIQAIDVSLKIDTELAESLKQQENLYRFHHTEMNNTIRRVQKKRKQKNGQANSRTKAIKENA